MTEVLEITRKALIFERSVMSASVIPSAKKSWSGSREKFSRGNTARERTCAAAPGLNRRPRQLIGLSSARATTTSTPIEAAFKPFDPYGALAGVAEGAIDWLPLASRRRSATISFAD